MSSVSSYFLKLILTGNDVNATRIMKMIAYSITETFSHRNEWKFIW